MTLCQHKDVSTKIQYINGLSVKVKTLKLDLLYVKVEGLKMAD